MNKVQNHTLNLRVASPCKADWNEMTGNDRVRFCRQCNLNVYDLALLTTDEVVQLIGSNGRICGRLHRRLDGTVITRDCPVGLRALRKRASRRVTAAVTALLSLSSALMGQTREAVGHKNEREQIKIDRRIIGVGEDGRITGTLADPSGAVVPGAEVVLISESSGQTFQAMSNGLGDYSVEGFSSGTYTIRITAHGFRSLELKHVALKSSEVARTTLTLDPESMTVGLIMAEEPVETNTIIFAGDRLRRLPINN